MRFCKSCAKFTAGKPLYCQFCGRSYGVKLCPRGHRNPRAANACSQCGSLDLSTPHSSNSGMSRIGVFIGFLILGSLILFEIYFAIRLAYAPDSLLEPMQWGLGLALALLVWSHAFGHAKRK